MRRLWVLVFLVPTCVCAKTDLTCVTKIGKRLQEPASLSALTACQQKKLDAASAAHLKKNKASPPDALLDAWEEAQRAEVRDYVRRHPDRAALDGPPQDLLQDKPKDLKDTDALGKSLQEMSDGGKKGVTPEMAGKIEDYLKSNQGGVSPDMQDLLDSVQKDGAKLTPETFSKLQDAASKAKGQGLDLNVDKKTEDILLAPKEPKANTN